MSRVDAPEFAERAEQPLTGPAVELEFLLIVVWTRQNLRTSHGETKKKKPNKSWTRPQSHDPLDVTASDTFGPETGPVFIAVFACAVKHRSNIVGLLSVYRSSCVHFLLPPSLSPTSN